MSTLTRQERSSSHETPVTQSVRDLWCWLANNAHNDPFLNKLYEEIDTAVSTGSLRAREVASGVSTAPGRMKSPDNRRLWVWRDQFFYPQISYTKPEGRESIEYVRADLIREALS